MIEGILSGLIYSLSDTQRHVVAYVLLGVLIVLPFAANYAAKRHRRVKRYHRHAYSNKYRRLTRYERILARMRLI